MHNRLLRLRFLLSFVVVTLFAVSCTPPTPNPGTRPANRPTQTTPPNVKPQKAPPSAPTRAPTPPPANRAVPSPSSACAIGPQASAAANAASLSSLAVSVFRRSETGWAFYEPLIAAETGTSCAGPSPGFARALSAWQSVHGLPPSGKVDAATLDRLKQVWQGRRPFVVESRQTCPNPPAEEALEHAAPSESYGGKDIVLLPQALSAYRALVIAARKDGVVPRGGPLLQIFSGFRSPAYDDARCAAENNCQGVVRATCSAHRTGLAMDIDLGAAPGFKPDSSDDANRLFISQSALYRWLVKNGRRFGLVNYAFEPWHWEYVATPPSSH